jgi:hypothetical protein
LVFMENLSIGNPADPFWAPWLCVPGSHRVCL